MTEPDFEQLARFIGFDDQDVANLRTLGTHAAELLPNVVDRFYDAILRHPRTRAVLAGGPPQVDRLRKSLTAWLRGLFTGGFDAAYWAQRARIGRVHLQVALPQEYMVASMQLLWEELERAVRGLGLPDAAAKLASLHKLLSLELAVMLDGYRESYAEAARKLEREAVKERLTEAEHLAQIGQLAASLAHEIKNPLAGISGAIQVMRDSLPAKDRHRPILDEILRQVGRLDGTVKDLLVYARPRPPRFRKCNVNDLITRLVTVLREQPEMQRVQFEYVNSQKLPLIEADENQIEQLLTNLLLNAAQASPDEGLVRLTSAAGGGGVRLTVEDRGTGMDEEVRRRASEPFFTTKAKGTGLGLPICHKIVEAHGGKLSIRSVVGEGTEVVVDLPLRQAHSPEAAR